MNSRWQASKIGLINFWYYDEQEFPFVKGRMLLRGSNGSGKSVTMQSVIPLLLDGNLSPERLDPFGSRDRKMSSYLLEEDDEREERTGYLYLEFRREESDVWLTIGMGIRARKGKPLDKWYFGLMDGRRIGKDFRLYKEMKEKVPLSKKELENRIADGGQVFERQTDYMAYVNRQIFGFETIEEYKEMIDLLIQLRTPKLSRDFKPSVVNDILSDSLQALSDEDLRPMSEAIENMDTMNMNLKARESACQAAGKIQKVLDKYSRLVLFEKVERWTENEKKLSGLKKEEKELREGILRCRQRISDLDQENADLEARRDAMEKEKDSLSTSDAVCLKNREMDLVLRVREREELLEEKKRQLGIKQEKFTETETQKKKDEDRLYAKERELNDILEEMQAEAEAMAFEEHVFFQDELKENFTSEYSWDVHQIQYEKTKQGIHEGAEILKKAEERQRDADEILKERDRHQRETDALKRQENELEDVLVQEKHEWKENLYRWNEQNNELVFSVDQMRQMALFADSYGEESDYAEVRTTAADLWLKKKGEFTAQKQEKEKALEALEEEYRNVREELEQWEHQREPEPDRSEAVVRNRQRLKELGIPFQEFYKVVEFEENMDQATRNRLEEALLEMGILDALVVEEQYRSRVLETDFGCADKYLFVGSRTKEESLLNVLDISDSANDIFMNHRITGILGGIAWNPDENDEINTATAVYPDGTYRIGAVNGTISCEHEAGFIGMQARERNRQAKIAACRALLVENGERQERLKEKLSELEARIVTLHSEYEALPSDEGMKTAWNMLSDIRRELERRQKETGRLEEKLRIVSEILKELRHQAAEIARKLYLDCSFAVFHQAEESANAYEKHFYQLKSGHEVYLQIDRHMTELGERLEELDEEMDQIRYEEGNINRQRKKETEELYSVREQLKLTDYEQIRHRLDTCLEWLKAYPGRLRTCVQEKTRNQEQIQSLNDRVLDCEEKIREYQRRNTYLKICYEAERDLNYVQLPEEISVSAEKVKNYLAPDCKNLDKEKMIQSLNQVYFENRAFLTDYQIMQTELFGDLQSQQGDPPAKRLDISARYQGVRIPFGRLLVHLEEEIEELKELIRDGDRELFEDILANTVSRKIRGRINASIAWVGKMNSLMGVMNTSSGLKLNLKWRSRTAEAENQLDTKELVELLKKDYRLMREDEAAKLSAHFRSKVEEARRHAKDSGGMISFYQVMKDTLDYRKWFEFQLFFQKGSERVRELTNNVFGTFSGGEKAMAMYVPLFSAVVAKYAGARRDAPRLISLDEAFAGVDSRNIRDMFRLMAEFQFNFIINSQVLWGDCDTLDALAIYQLIRPENAKFVTVMPYLWNGYGREMLENEPELEEKAARLD